MKDKIKAPSFGHSTYDLGVVLDFIISTIKQAIFHRFLRDIADGDILVKVKLNKNETEVSKVRCDWDKHVVDIYIPTNQRRLVKTRLNQSLEEINKRFSLSCIDNPFQNKGLKLQLEVIQESNLYDQVWIIKVVNI